MSKQKSEIVPTPRDFNSRGTSVIILHHNAHAYWLTTFTSGLSMREMRSTIFHEAQSNKDCADPGKRKTWLIATTLQTQYLGTHGRYCICWDTYHRPRNNRCVH